MLVLARKVGEEIVIDGAIRVKVVAVRGNRVRLGLQAPLEIGICRAKADDLDAEPILVRDPPEDTADEMDLVGTLELV
jgi:carbon storage regulator